MNQPSERAPLPALPDDPDANWRRYLAVRTFGLLDGIRALCIAAVIWHHVPHEGSEPEILNRGFLGVDMFFVLSGFLIVTLILREKARNSDVSLPKFYARRTLRIFPVYYLLIFSLLAYYRIFKNDSDSAVDYYHDFPYLASYLSNWAKIRSNNMGITWSLSTEEQFYLVWPLIEKLLTGRWVMAILLAFIGVNQAVNFGLLDSQIRAIYGGPGVEVPPIWQTTFTPIALGVLLAHLLDQRDSFRRLYAWIGRRWSSVSLFMILLALLQFSPADIGGAPRLAIQVTMMLTLGSLVVREDQPAVGFLRLRPLRFVGMISYGIYLYHLYAVHLVLSAFRRLHLSPNGMPGGPAIYTLVLFVASALASVLVAWLSFRLFEAPILRLKSRFSA